MVGPAAMSSKNVRWWLVALAAVGLATATISLGWLASPTVSAVGFLVAMGAGLWHQRAARLATEECLREREGLINVVVDGATDAPVTMLYEKPLLRNTYRTLSEST